MPTDAHDRDDESSRRQDRWPGHDFDGWDFSRLETGPENARLPANDVPAPAPDPANTTTDGRATPTTTSRPHYSPSNAVNRDPLIEWWNQTREGPTNSNPSRGRPEPGNRYQGQGRAHFEDFVDNPTSSGGSWEEGTARRREQRWQQQQQHAAAAEQPHRILDTEDESSVPQSAEGDFEDLDDLFGDNLPGNMPATTRRFSTRANDNLTNSLVDLTADSPAMERGTLSGNSNNQAASASASPTTNTRKRRRDSDLDVATPPTSAQQVSNSAITDTNPRPRKRNHCANRTTTTIPNTATAAPPLTPENENPSAEDELLTAQCASALAAQQAREAKGVFPLGKRQCIICMEPFTAATATACGHIYCHECLTRALIAGEKAAAEGQGNGQRGQGFCPMCRKPLKRKNRGEVVVVSFMTKGRFQRERETRENGGVIDGSGGAGGGGQLGGKGKEVVQKEGAGKGNVGKVRR